MSNPFGNNNILNANEYIKQKSFRTHTKYFSYKPNKCFTKENSKKNNKIFRTINQSNKLDLYKGYFLDKSKYITKQTLPKSVSDGKNTVVEQLKCKCVYICTCNNIKDTNCKKAELIIPKNKTCFDLNNTNHMKFYTDK